MAKRVRGKRSAAYKPGGQGPSRAKEDGAGSTTSSAPDLEAAIDDAADDVVLETTEISIEEAAPATPRRRKAARRSARAVAESLEGRATAEESWVREDLRSIGIITVVLVAGLLLAWIVFVPLNLTNLY